MDRAARAVAHARHDVEATRRAFMRRQAGAADIDRAEHDLARALDELARLEADSGA